MPHRAQVHPALFSSDSADCTLFDPGGWGFIPEGVKLFPSWRPSCAKAELFFAKSHEGGEYLVRHENL
jgi:hypothetical protein